MKKIQGGFTLIELVMVMVIVGILAAVAMPKYVDMTSAANTAAGKAGIMAANSALASVMASNAATTPTNPYPSLTQLNSVGGMKLASDNSGVCAGSGQKIVAYKVDGTAASAASDKISSFAAAATADATNCP